MANRVDGDRLWNRLMAMAEVGPAAHGGSNRQAISDEDAAGRALLLDWATAARCTAETDEIGNLFIRRPGRDNTLPPVMVGSHLDTQPTGGRFDGVYGVLGGFEVIESLNDMGRETEAPIENLLCGPMRKAQDFSTR
jgi:N-carbamoyl-L-amino-acid hydrolase